MQMEGGWRGGEAGKLAPQQRHSSGLRVCSVSECSREFALGEFFTVFVNFVTLCLACFDTFFAILAAR